MIRNPNLFRFVFGIRLTCVIHVGAQNGQSREDYLNLGARKFIWYEALPELASRLKTRNSQDTVFEGVVWSIAGLDVQFYQFEDTENSSAIQVSDFSHHKLEKTHNLKTITLDGTLNLEQIDNSTLLVVDVQGAELQVLKGATQLLQRINYIVCEIGITNQGYRAVPSESALSEFLSLYGFEKSIIRSSKNGNYYDQLYLRSSRYKRRWIKYCDKSFDLGMRIRHFLKYAHLQKVHYHCDACEF